MTKSRRSRSAYIVAAMMSGALVLLAGCPAAKPPEQAPEAPPPAKTVDAPKAQSAEAPQVELPKKSELPTLPLTSPQTPAKPETPAAKPIEPPAAKTPPAKPTAQAVPAKKPPTIQAAIRPATKPQTTKKASQPASEPVVKVERTGNEVREAAHVSPATADRRSSETFVPRMPPSEPIRSPGMVSDRPAMRPVPLSTSPAYSLSADGWTARPNPLRGGQAPAEPSDTKPGMPQATSASGSPRVESSLPRSEGLAAAAHASVGRHVEAGMGRGATKKTDFDPIKENGRIFVDWPKPRAALVITGRQEGYIEPCGCAGLDRMKGGIGRRHALFDKLRSDGWPIVCMDLGGISKGFGRQAELKFQTTVEAFKRMGYNAIGLGTTDLRLPGAELLSAAKGVGTQQSPFISANVGLFVSDPPMIDAYRVIKAGDLRIGVTAVLGAEALKRVQNGDVIKEDPEKKLADLLPKLKKEADYLVLLAYADTKESIALGRRFPEFQVVVTAGGAPEPPAEPARIDGKSLLVEVGDKGQNAIVIGLYDDPQVPWRYQRVPLDSRFKNSPEMRMLMESYQDQLKTLGYSGLGLRSVPHPQKRLLGNFVGSEKCEACHSESYRVWKKTGHARAFQTLADLNPPRNFDPECISCHVIGWHPQDWFPYDGGYSTQETTPKLVNVGCESCHGPGGAHVAAEQSDDEKVQGTLRRAMVVSKEESHQRLCGTCHDGDNSPDFKFETYFPGIEHHEKK